MARLSAREFRNQQIGAMGYLGGFVAAAAIATASPEGQKATNGFLGYVGGAAATMAITAALTPPPKQPANKRR